MNSSSGMPLQATNSTAPVVVAPTMERKFLLDTLSAICLVIWFSTGQSGPEYLEVAGRAVDRRIVIAVAVHALAHLQRLHLLHLFHCRDAPMTGRTDLCRLGGCQASDGRVGISDHAGVISQKSNMRIVNEPD